MTDFAELARNLEPPTRLEDINNVDVRDPFPIEALPESLRDWAPHAAKALGVPVSVTAMVGLPILSAAIGLCETHTTDTWKARAAIWVMLLADPGKKKSPILELMSEAVLVAENKYKKIWLHEQSAKRLEVEQAGKSVTTAKTELAGATTAHDIERARAALYTAECALAAAEERLGHMPDLTTQDSTPQGLCDQLSEQDRVLALIPEGDAVVRRLTGSDTSSAAIWLQSKNGESSKTRLREKGTVEAKKPYLAAVMAAQSVVLRSILADETLDGGGWLDRWLVVPIGNTRPALMAEMRAAAADPDARRARENWASLITEAYLATSGLRAEGLPVPQLAFDPEATKVWDAVYDSHQMDIYDAPGQRPGSALKGDQLAVAIAAMRAMERVILSHVHAVSARSQKAAATPKTGAPVVSPTPPTRELLDTSKTFPIPAADVAAGWKIAQWSMRRIDEVYGEHMTESGAENQLRLKVIRYLRSRVEKGQEVLTLRQIQSGVRGVNKENIVGIIDALSLLSWLVHDTKGGGPLSKWEVYPRPDIGMWIDKYNPEPDN